MLIHTGIYINIQERERHVYNTKGRDMLIIPVFILTGRRETCLYIPVFILTYRKGRDMFINTGIYINTKGRDMLIIPVFILTGRGETCL